MAYDGRSMMVFGGHRLWHGFATDNSEANLWSSYAEYPKGGYLQDLWVYTKKQLGEEEQARRLMMFHTLTLAFGVLSTYCFVVSRWMWSRLCIQQHFKTTARYLYGVHHSCTRAFVLDGGGG